MLAFLTTLSLLFPSQQQAVTGSQVCANDMLYTAYALVFYGEAQNSQAQATLWNELQRVVVLTEQNCGHPF